MESGPSNRPYSLKILRWLLRGIPISFIELEGLLVRKQVPLASMVAFRQSLTLGKNLDGDACRVCWLLTTTVVLTDKFVEAFGEDKILTSLIGVAYSSGLSKNGSWAEPDAVFPIMKVL